MVDEDVFVAGGIATPKARGVGDVDGDNTIGRGGGEGGIDVNNLVHEASGGLEIDPCVAFEGEGAHREVADTAIAGGDGVGRQVGDRDGAANRACAVHAALGDGHRHAGGQGAVHGESAASSDGHGRCGIDVPGWVDDEVRADDGSAAGVGVARAEGEGATAGNGESAARGQGILKQWLGDHGSGTVAIGVDDHAPAFHVGTRQA